MRREMGPTFPIKLNTQLSQNAAPGKLNAQNTDIGAEFLAKVRYNFCDKHRFSLNQGHGS